MGALWQTDSTQAAKVQGSSDPAPLSKNKRGPRYGLRLFGLIVLLALIALGFAASKEMRTSRLQAQELSRLARDLAAAPPPCLGRAADSRSRCRTGSVGIYELQRSQPDYADG